MTASHPTTLQMPRFRGAVEADLRPPTCAVRLPRERRTGCRSMTAKRQLRCGGRIISGSMRDGSMMQCRHRDRPDFHNFSET